jgi:hypothetical protein
MPLEPADATREWMSATDRRFANRCLPLLIANQSGWIVRNTVAFTAIWSGLESADATLVEYDPSPERPRAGTFFGYGILTWSIPYVFRTPPGINLLVRGPANLPKDAVAPLEGVVESDWASSTFTMNWKITRPFTPVRFEVGEPVCMLVPQRRGELESYAPEILPLSADPALAARHEAWARSRQEFLRAKTDGWQRDYFQGRHVDGSSEDAAAHQTRIHLTPFRSPASPTGDHPGTRADRRLEPRREGAVHE